MKIEKIFFNFDGTLSNDNDVMLVSIEQVFKKYVNDPTLSEKIFVSY